MDPSCLTEIHHLLHLALVGGTFRNIVVPDTTSYVVTGPNTPVRGPGFGYDCTLSASNDSGSAPYIDIAVSINGVDYMLDSKDNMIRPPSSKVVKEWANVCNVAMSNRTSAAAPAIVLGMPFLRSVYV
jgi:hypothetical protein